MPRRNAVCTETKKQKPICELLGSASRCSSDAVMHFQTHAHSANTQTASLKQNATSRQPARCVSSFWQENTQIEWRSCGGVSALAVGCVQPCRLSFIQLLPITGVGESPPQTDTRKQRVFAYGTSSNSLNHRRHSWECRTYSLINVLHAWSNISLVFKAFAKNDKRACGDPRASSRLVEKIDS